MHTWAGRLVRVWSESSTCVYSTSMAMIGCSFAPLIARQAQREHTERPDDPAPESVKEDRDCISDCWILSLLDPGP